MDFLERYAETGFTSFKDAIWYEDGPSQDLLVRIKHGAFSLNEFRYLVQEKRDHVSNYESRYKEQVQDLQLKEWLDNHIKELVKESILRDNGYLNRKVGSQ